MKNSKIIILTLIAATLFQSCVKPKFIDLPESFIESVNDLIIPASFDWKTTKTLNVSVVLPDDGAIKPLTITDSSGNKTYFRGYPDDGSRTVSTIITIPSYVKKVKLAFGDNNESSLDLVSNSSMNYNFNTANKSAKKNTVSPFNLGLIANFTLFSGAGAISNTGTSNITGDIGTNTGSISGFGVPSILNGNIQNANTITLQAALDLTDVIDQIVSTPVTNTTHAPAFTTETLTSGVYSTAGAASIAGTLTLDAEGDQDAIFIFKIGGALTTAVGTTVVLINGASADNIYWLATGAISMGTSTTISGNLIGNPGAVSMGDGGDLSGRMLSAAGAISLLNCTTLIKKTNIESSSSCTNLGVAFTIINKGVSMTSAQVYTLFKNDVEVLSDTYQLELDESIEITSVAITDDNFKLLVSTLGQGDLEESIQNCGVFPSEQYEGSLAYEDLYPGKGDSDFNDLVLNYDFKISKNNQEVVQSITATFVIRAFGASTHNGFGFTLPKVEPNDIVSVSGFDVSNNNVFSIAGNGLENGQNKATIIVFDDAYRIMPPTGGGTGANTQTSYGYTEPVTVVVEIDFDNINNPITFSELNIGTFNPFMIVGTTVDGAPGVRGKEIHLPNYEPSDLFDNNYFQSVSDDSSPKEGRYFVTANNLPWAINVTEEFNWAIEFEDITKAYNMFGDWAQNNGTIFPDWYKNNTGFRNNSLIYN